MQQPYEVRYTDNAVLDLIEILYWRVFGMNNYGACDQDTHINKLEVLSMLEDVRKALEDK